MSMYVSGGRKKVEKVRELAEKLGLKPLYHEDRISLNALNAAMRTSKRMEREIGLAVFEMEKKYRELGKPVTPADITGHSGVTYRDTERTSNMLRLAYLKGMVERKDVSKGSRPVYVYSPKKAK